MKARLALLYYCEFLLLKSILIHSSIYCCHTTNHVPLKDRTSCLNLEMFTSFVLHNWFSGVSRQSSGQIRFYWRGWEHITSIALVDIIKNGLTKIYPKWKTNGNKSLLSSISRSNQSQFIAIVQKFSKRWLTGSHHLAELILLNGSWKTEQMTQ